MRRAVAGAALAALFSACGQTHPANPPGRERRPAPRPTSRGPEPAPTGLTATTGFGCEQHCNGGVGQVLAAALRERAQAARTCYENALKKDPSLAGRLVVGLQLADDGSVCASRLVKDTLKSPEVASCIRGLFVGQRFPAPTAGCVNVALPLAFVTKVSEGGTPDADAGSGDAGAP